MSIVDVAKLAGVSHATVSRVINRHPRVSSASVQRVRHAMQQLNYTPPTRRRGPRSKVRMGISTHNVALLFVGADMSLQRAPVISAMVHGVEDALSNHNLTLSLAHAGDNRPLPRNVASGQVDGIILIGREPAGQTRKTLMQLPTVWLGSRASDRWGDHVAADRLKVGHLAAQYLNQLGHTHVAVMNIEASHPGLNTTLRSFESTSQHLGATVSVFEAAVAAKDTSLRPHAEVEQIESLVDQMLATTPRPTALHVVADMQAVVVHRLLQRKGIEPGRDIALVSVNNERVLLAGLDPRPATVDIGAEALGRRAVDQLLWRMSNRHEPRRVCISMEPQLILPDGVTIYTPDHSTCVSDDSNADNR